MSRTRINWPLVVLTASLALNGVLAGILATSYFRSADDTHRVSRPLRLELRSFAERLPEASVDRIVARLAAVEGEAEGHISRLRALRREINGLAAEPSPDRAAIDHRFAEIRQEVAALQSLVQSTTIDAVLELPPDVRTRLAPPAE
ncbi:periplasmic heavy metal sensor [Faunimonas sp. B44]|uniref:periplasmic heavy metal sensor n=1 Tax=Faunimonas sp. B44 TaxID=3461493 RepID=UPI0040444916